MSKGPVRPSCRRLGGSFVDVLVVVVGVGLCVVFLVGLQVLLLSGVKLDCRGGMSLVTVQVQRLNVLFNLLSCEVLRHEVGGVGRTLSAQTMLIRHHRLFL